MCARQDSGDPVVLVQLNGGLRDAHSELRSAERAAERLRVRFTVDQIARHAEPEMLSSAQTTAMSLYDYFSSIPTPIGGPDGVPSLEGPELDENQILDAIDDITAYMREQREKYAVLGQTIDVPEARIMGRFFSPTLLAKVKIVQLADHGLGRIEVKLKAKSHQNLLQLTHMASVTFEDVLVFNEALTARTLFHALVHAVQFRLLGLPRYTELYVRAFVATRWRFNVPLEAHAFELESRFAVDPGQAFAVEDEVRLWIEKGRY